MNLDSRSDGRKKKKVICIVCNWFLVMVENVMLMVRLVVMKRRVMM